MRHHVLIEPMRRLTANGILAATISAVVPAVAAAADQPVWHASTFRAVSGSHSAWCGSPTVTSCGPGDQDGGYGRHYDEILEWRGIVADAAQPCTLSVSALVNIDTMDGYDYFFASVVTAATPQLDLLFQAGLHDSLPIATQFVYGPDDYVGAGGDEVVVRFRVTSDGGWDGQDCLWPNDGAVQLDDVVISLSNGAGYEHDFEDGTLGDFRIAYRSGGYASIGPAAAAVAVRAHPNPFNPSTTISYSVQRPGLLTIAVFDVRGRLLRTLLERQVDASGAAGWDGTDANGRPLGAGVYFVRAAIGGEMALARLVLAK
jgi:hypothetical protein